ncbi:cyanophycinase [Alteribacter aurantiacus]|uniref:cyanophycinase n=1 Tax=Alteribacter aurantiacus TaxID=254410 RepID=UPI00040BC8A3|nr:cyanophycinase [Alteribacter aurantiacus]
MKKTGQWLLVVLLITGLFSFPNNGEAARGSHLVMIGGALGSSEGAEAIYEKMVALSGGETGKIGVITASSYPYDWDCEERGETVCNNPNTSNSKMNANYYIKAFGDYGIDAEWIPVDIANTDVADDTEWAERIRSGEFSGFFFGGGDQDRYITSLVRGDDWEDSAVLGAIRERFDSGQLMIAGSSAGAAVQVSEYMITGGDSYQGIRDGSIEGYHDSARVLGYYKEGGLGFFTYGLIDSHFTQWAREGRMIRLAADTGVDMVYGIDETTALVVENANHPSVKMEVVGENGVQILDLSQSMVSIDESDNWGISGIQSTYLNHGDKYLPTANNPVFHSKSKPVHGGETELDVYDDIFYEDNAYRTMVWDLLTSNESSVTGTSWENDPEYSLTAHKTNQTKTRLREAFGEERWSYSNVEISIYPSE